MSETLHDIVLQAAHALADAECGQWLVAEYLREVKSKPRDEALRITDEWLDLLT